MKDCLGGKTLCILRYSKTTAVFWAYTRSTREGLGEWEGGKETEAEGDTERESWERASASALPGRACGRTLGEARTLRGSHPHSLHLASHTPLTPGALPILAIISELWREEFLCATRHLNASQFPHSVNPLEKQESALTVEDRLLLDNWRDAHRSVLTTWGFSLCSHCGVKGNTSPLDEARPWVGGGEWSAFPQNHCHWSAPSHWDNPSGSFRTINTCTTSVVFSP